MAERISALARMPSLATEGARVTLAEARPAAMLQVQAWPDTLAAVETALAQALTTEALPQPGHAHAFDGGAIAALGAGRFMIVATRDEAAARIGAALSDSDATITDISHGRTILALEGAAAAALLARCVALDLDPAAFPPGRATQTNIHHIDVLLRRVPEGSFEVWVFRSFAEALAEWLIDAGAEIGLSFKAE